MSDNDRVQRTVEELAGVACRRVFEAYGVSLHPAAPAHEPVQFLLAGVVGFAGRSLRGSLILAATVGPLDRSHPSQRAPATRGDWIGELANQIAGHIKSGLLAYGVEIFVNLPAVMRGSHLAPLPRREVSPATFTDGGGHVCLWVDVDSAPTLRMKAEPEWALAGRESGEPLLFETNGGGTGSGGDRGDGDGDGNGGEGPGGKAR